MRYFNNYNLFVIFSKKNYLIYKIQIVKLVFDYNLFPLLRQTLSFKKLCHFCSKTQYEI